MAEHDPFAHDPGMKELHQRDLRNSATPIHTPAVQHVDYKAAEDEGRLEDTDAMTSTSVEGDADFAVSAAEYVSEQIEDRAERMRPDDDQPPFDNTTPDDSDEDQSPLNAFGNVAPEHAIESDADRDANLPLDVPATAQSDPTRASGEPVGDREDDSELATASDTESRSKDSNDESEDKE